MIDEKVYKFGGFLKDKADVIHSDTWKYFADSKNKCKSEWECAKEKEILIGEIIREYKDIFGKIK